LLQQKVKFMPDHCAPDVHRCSFKSPTRMHTLLRWRSFLLFCALLQNFTVHPAEDVRRDAVVQAVEKAIPAVVNIGTETVTRLRDPFEEALRDFFDPYHRNRPPNTQFSLGSGVIVDEEGYLITNHHVVQRADKIRVMTSDQTEHQAVLVAADPGSDLALLKIIGSPGKKFKALPLAADDDLLLGETVVAVGNPFGLGVSVSRGILSSKSRAVAKENQPLDIPNWLQTDASINPGNSGGALINLRGELIGVNVAVLREAQGIGFAIPVRRVNEVLSQMATPETLKGLWFGARFRMQAPGQILFSHVDPGSPAHQAGIKSGDQLRRVNGVVAKTYIEALDLLLKSPPGKEIKLELVRDKTPREVRVTMTPEDQVFNSAYVRKRTGLTLQPITPDLAQRLGLPSAEGFLIREIDKRSPAAEGPLHAGHIILTFAGSSFGSIKDLGRFLSTKSASANVPVEVLVLARRGGFITVQRAEASIRLRD
jgi:S1-C subfamily serine protease